MTAVDDNKAQDDTRVMQINLCDFSLHMFLDWQILNSHNPTIYLEDNMLVA
jgi:hypothetical protein